jgi:uncharacterized OB-fold protein
MTQEHPNCFVVEGKLALPYQYFAGEVGSRFLNALRDEQKILGQRCDKCGKVFVPPRQTCERCFADLSNAWVELGQTGQVVGFTVVKHKEPHYPLPPPFVMALIKLDGADSPFVHLIGGVAPDKVKVGMKVKAVFADERIGSLLDIKHFAPA